MTDLFHERLRKIIDTAKSKKGFTSNTQVYKDMDIPKQTMSEYLNGKQRPNYETSRKICEYGNVSTDFLRGLPETISDEERGFKAAEYLGVSSGTIDKLKNIFDIAQGGNLLSVFEGVIQDDKFEYIFQELRNVNEFVLFPGDPAFITITDEMYDRRGIPKDQREPNRKVMIDDGFEGAVLRSNKNAAAVIDNAIEIISEKRKKT